MNYLELVNKVVDESGKEQDNLTLLTWNSAEAGRRIYPRIKRLVREAWKKIQMSRNEWEFKTAELNFTVYPRLKFTNGTGPLPQVGDRFLGLQSGTIIEARVIELREGAWADADAGGQIEFNVITGSQITLSETFLEVGGSTNFQYVEKGSYPFFASYTEARNPLWDTFVAGRGTAYPNPVTFVPWDNWTYKSYSFVGTSQSVPNYVSEDFEGRMVFYPQPLAPFQLNFVYNVSPQELTEPTDVPVNLHPEYHDWIAWEALKNLARFDKDPDLYAYADSMATTYKYRAERNLLPEMGWRVSAFNRRR